MLKYVSDKDVASGLLFTVIGIIGFSLSMSFQFGSTAQPGPAFFPTVISVFLILIGIFIAGSGIIRNRNPIEPFAFRPLILITAAVCTFATIINLFGLIPAVFSATIVASFAKKGFGLWPRLAVAAGLATFSALLFVGLLNLPIPLLDF